MDTRFAAHVAITALLTVALAVLPSAIAHPTTPITAPPAMTGQEGSTAPRPAIGAAHADPGAPEAPSESVSTAASCPDVHQLGQTVHTLWHGMIAFSVKEFYSPSCRVLFAYAYPWLQFRQLKVRYDLGLAVFDTTHDAIDGARTFLRGGDLDYWSKSVSASAGTCVSGLAHVFFPDTQTDTLTPAVCM
jgi:hypothetical protein